MICNFVFFPKKKPFGELEQRMRESSSSRKAEPVFISAAAFVKMECVDLW